MSIFDRPATPTDLYIGMGIFSLLVIGWTVSMHIQTRRIIANINKLTADLKKYKEQIY